MKGKVVLVTGANGGLGTYVTQAFLDAGATVIGTSRKIEQSDSSNPGTMDTSANRKAIPNADVSKWVQPTTVAELVVWLAGEPGKDVNGSLIPVFGKDA
jgi:NAD(P)-dependent dehydrogenase (short-subunit alcohol dehydrogenase family)